jgi:nitrogenase-stabilizing/protective protein
VRYADTLGLLDPFEHPRAHGGAAREIDIGIEMHAHNDLGLATANTLAARARRRHARQHHRQRPGRTRRQRRAGRSGDGRAPPARAGLRRRHHRAAGHLATRGARASGRPVAAGKSIVGEAVFTHESGIHVDGLLKDRATTKPSSPKSWAVCTGWCWASIRARTACVAPMRGWAWCCPNPTAQTLLDCIRAHVSDHQARADDAELLHLALQCLRERHSAPSLPDPPPLETPMPSLTERLKALSSAEDFFESSSAMPFDERVVQVNRLHILKRFYQYLHTSDGLPRLDDVEQFRHYRGLLGQAYQDFVRSTPGAEKVFKVFQEAGGTQHVQASALRDSLAARRLAPA